MLQDRVDSSRLDRLRRATTDPRKPGHSPERAGHGRSGPDGRATPRQGAGDGLCARLAALAGKRPRSSPRPWESSGRRSSGCRTSTRGCGRGCWSTTSAASSRRSIASGRSSPKTSARPRARCSAQADERVQAAVMKLLKRHKEGTIGLVVPEPLASLVRRFITPRRVGRPVEGAQRPRPLGDPRGRPEEFLGKSSCRRRP